MNAIHITDSVFINDDASGLHHDYNVSVKAGADYAGRRGALDLGDEN